MFELEVGTTTLAIDELPAEARIAFGIASKHVTAFSLTPWKEHCTECAMPACYATCDLYEARRDGKCRRFAHGIQIIPMPEHPQGYVAKVTFKRWGKLMAYANARLIPTDQARAIERRVRRVERIAAAAPGASISVASRRGVATRMTSRWKHRIRDRAGEAILAGPDCLLLEVFNPAADVVGLSLLVSNPDHAPFEARLELRPGFQAIEVPIAPIQACVDLEGDLMITLDPNVARREDPEITLYFGLLAFVAGPAGSGASAVAAASTGQAVKVAVWDLDNTLWSGTLIEDGLEGVRLRDDVVAVIKELDRRGIVNSVLSKNDTRDGLAALEHFGIAEWFAFPKIEWSDKGRLLKRMVRDFDLDIVTFAFIDDQAFERAEVAAANPGIRTYDSTDVRALLDLVEFRPMESAESSNRRLFYQAEEQRVEVYESVGGDRLAFLRTCDLRIDISHPHPGSSERIHELVQRTNQLNYSGVHYSRAQATAIIDDPAHESYVVSCQDRFGDYGTVGFLVVDTEQKCLRDAMFSCRVHFKRVEHAALVFLLQMFRARHATHFDARFHETDRNAAAAEVFADLGFREIARQGPDRLYRFDLDHEAVVDDGIATITYKDLPWEPQESSGV